MQVCESVLRENLGQFYLSEILTNKRQEIELLNKEHIQRILDEYKAGIEILSVQMLRVDPPGQVIDAFRDVQTARVDRESEINKAMVYYNTIIPEARGSAKEIITQAESLAFEKINKAKGEAIMFDKIYSQYRSAPAVTRARMYIEKMEEIFKKSDITIVDSSLKNVFLNTNKLTEKQASETKKDTRALQRSSQEEQEIAIKQQNGDISLTED
jgi:membrane protease subunit HflK